MSCTSSIVTQTAEMDTIRQSADIILNAAHHRNDPAATLIAVKVEANLIDRFIEILRRLNYTVYNLDYSSKETLLFDPSNKSRPVTHATQQYMESMRAEGKLSSVYDLAEQYNELVERLIALDQRDYRFEVGDRLIAPDGTFYVVMNRDQHHYHFATFNEKTLGFTTVKDTRRNVEATMRLATEHEQKNRLMFVLNMLLDKDAAC